MNDFVDFLYEVVSILLDIHWSYKNMLLLASIVRRRLSANQIARCFKLKNLKNSIELVSCFHWSYKKYAIGLCLQNSLGQSVYSILYFWLVWLVNLNTRGPFLHCACLKFFFSPRTRCAIIMFLMRDNSAPKMDFRWMFSCPRDHARFLAILGES